LRLGTLRIWLLAGLLLAGTSVGTHAGVRVVDDEVVFTLRAPEANRVFLTGDFNNWNPTLERMNKEGDVFVLRLYLLPGVHRYKYVVDGEWRVDPDNEPRDPKRGSLLVLEERSGMLVMGSEEAVETETAVTLEPSLRYTGEFILDDGDTRSDQTLDFYFAYESKRLRSNVDFKTTNGTWDLSPLQAKLWFNMGFVELKFGDAVFTAFENDTIWTSKDPLRLVGDVGIFDYNVGRERKGFSFESPELLKTRLRALYTDKIEERLFTPVTIPSSAFGGFAAGSAADTLVYRYDGSLFDEDTWAIELFADLGSFDFGYVNRSNRGLHPGLLTAVGRGAGVYELSTFNTREFWGADVLWLTWAVWDGVTLGGGFGHSNAQLRQTAGSVSADTTLGDVGIGQDTEKRDGEIPIQSSKRWDGSIGYDRGGIRSVLTYRWNEYDFDSFVYDGSKAEISTVELDVRYAREKWSAGGVVRYIDQDYGETPADFHYFTPARNFWLDWGDALDVIGQVEFDLGRATDLVLTFGWNDVQYDPGQRLGPVVPFAFLVAVEAVTTKVFDSVEYVGARVDGEYGITDRFYVDLHARLARYDKPSWQARQTYIDSYLEVGYRDRRVSLSIGVGPDPIILDPIPNDYLNNGWERALRVGIPAGCTRDQSVELGQGLQGQEQQLEDNHALKLELIVFF
jgi:hypothetical protein